jgi:anti-anti-sigma factor
VVEDETIVALDIQNKLKKLGYDVPLFVVSGEEAIRKAGELRPDLVLMDIRLKGKMDGIAAAAKIRERYGIPVVYLTAYDDEDTVQRAKQSDAFGYLLKPLQEKDLRIAIEIALYRRQSESALEEARRQVQSRARQQAALAMAARLILDGAGLPKLMDETARLIVSTLETDLCEISELQPQQQALTMQAGAGWKLAGGQRTTALADAHYRAVLDQAGPLVFEHASADDRFSLSSLLQEHEVVSGVALRLQGQDGPWGVLGVYHRTARRFTEDEIDFLLGVASLVSLAVERERTEEVILKLSTPVLPIAPGLLMVPLIGAIDQRRAQQLIDQLLEAIRESRARVVVLDVTAVATMDNAVASTILRTVEAARLLSAAVLLTGISTDVARTLVRLGFDLTKVRTLVDLREGIEEATRLLESHRWS